MLHDVLHGLETKNRQKIFGPHFSNFYNLMSPQGDNFPNFLKNASKTLNIFHKTCFMTFYID